jgi:hypothetical protein
MSQYAQVFVVPRGTRDRIVKRFVSYLEDELTPFLKREPAIPVESSRLFVPSGNPKRLVRVTTPMRWFEIVAAFREEWNIEYGDLSDGPMYEDECVKWLQQQLDLDLYEIVITEET